jgi:ATP-dependent RNA helicase DHX8/PRP22
MADLLDLELVGLVSKVVSELQNHLGVVDKNLAEFIIAQRLDSDTFETFECNMTRMGGESLPPSLLHSIDRLIRMMHPSMKAKTAATYDEPLAAPGCDSFDHALAERAALEPRAHNNASRMPKRGRSRSRSRSPQTRVKRRGHADDRFKKPDSARKPERRMTSPERWEIRQLIASGVVKASDFPDLNYKPPPTVDGEPELEEDIDIEVRQEEPPFLVGQTK